MKADENNLMLIELLAEQCLPDKRREIFNADSIFKSFPIYVQEENKCCDTQVYEEREAKLQKKNICELRQTFWWNKSHLHIRLIRLPDIIFKEEMLENSKNRSHIYHNCQRRVSY